MIDFHLPGSSVTTVFLTIVFTLTLSNTSFAENSALSTKPFLLESSDIAEGKALSQHQVYQGFGCKGQNQSPKLAWKNPPTGTQSFAITAYDPDAPTGSGWWHWTLVNLPNTTHTLAAGITQKELPKSALQLRNDYGTIGFGGACPPPGEVHRYEFTVHALKVKSLELPENASNALAGFMIKANTLASDTITAIYTR